MRILHTVELYEPSKGGAQEVMRQISERLVKRGHEVTVATSTHPARRSRTISGVKIEEFHVAGNQVKGMRGETERFKSYLISSDHDLLLNYAAQTWTTDLTFSVLDQIRGKKLIAPLGYSRLGKRRYREYFRVLPTYLAKYDRIVYTSSDYRDKHYGDQNGFGEKSSIIPNGAAREEFCLPPIGFRQKFGITKKFMILNVSNHYFDKGHDFVLRAFRKMQIVDASLVIIGEKPYRHGWYSCFPFCLLSANRDERIRVLKNVPRELVVSAYKEADLFLFGSRLECAPLVMYECFASRTPLVARDVGNVRDHKEVVKIVNTPDEMAALARGLLHSENERNEISQRAYEIWSGSYSWDRIVEKYEALYASLL